MAVGSISPPNFSGEKPKTGRESSDAQIYPEEVRVQPGLSSQPYPQDTTVEMGRSISGRGLV